MSWEYVTEQHVVDGLLPTLMSKPSWGVDCETSDLDPFTADVLAVQVGRPEKQYIFDTRRVNLTPIKPFFDSEDVIKVGQNFNFDYKMMKWNLGIEVENIRDTFLGEKVLTIGKKFQGFGYGDLVQDRLGVELEKDTQKSFVGHQGEFTERQLLYMANDVKYLLPLGASIIQDLSRDGLIPTFLLECGALPAIADMELEGCEFDTDAWMKVRDDNIKEQKTVQKELDEIAAQFWQLDLWGKPDINYGSPDQVLRLFRLMKLKTIIWDHENREEKKVIVSKTDEKSLKAISNIPVVKLIQKWRSLNVHINTFGEAYIQAIHPVTNKLHPSVKQMGTETARLAKDSKGASFLNVPSDNRYRHCFLAGDDHVIETDDFSGCELRIWAEVSGDPKLRDAFNRGVDVHCAVASELFRIEVTKTNENKKFRKPAKALNFGWLNAA